MLPVSAELVQKSCVPSSARPQGFFWPDASGVTAPPEMATLLIVP